MGNFKRKFGSVYINLLRVSINQFNCNNLIKDTNVFQGQHGHRKQSWVHQIHQCKWKLSLLVWPDHIKFTFVTSDSSMVIISSFWPICCQFPLFWSGTREHWYSHVGSINSSRLSTQLCEKKGFFKRFDFQKKRFLQQKKKVFRAKWIAF